MAKKQKIEYTCFALIVKEWESYYEFGVNSSFHKDCYDDFEDYESGGYIDLICETYQD